MAPGALRSGGMGVSKRIFMDHRAGSRRSHTRTKNATSAPMPTVSSSDVVQMLHGAGRDVRRRLADMASTVAPSAQIDWTSARVRGRKLTVPLSGPPVGRMDDAPGQSGRARAATRGAADHRGRRRTHHRDAHPPRRRPDVHDLLEHLVAETNAAFATERPSHIERTDPRTRSRSIGASLLLIVLAGAAVALQWSKLGRAGSGRRR